MEQWVLVFTLYREPLDRLHVRGPFSSHENCLKYVRMVNTNPSVDQWLGRCVDRAEYLEYFADLPIELGES